MDFKLAKVYYSTKGYWKGIAAVKELAEAAKILEKMPSSGLSNKLFGKCISPRRATFLAQNSTYR